MSSNSQPSVVEILKIEIDLDDDDDDELRAAKGRVYPLKIYFFFFLFSSSSSYFPYSTNTLNRPRRLVSCSSSDSHSNRSIDPAPQRPQIASVSNTWNKKRKNI